MKLIEVRKLAALDIALHGWWLILIEFTAGVILLPIFGFFIVGRSLLLGVYMMFLGLDYVPLLVYGLITHDRESARKEVEAELSHMKQSGVKYGVQQLLLFVPLAIPLLSLAQELSRAADHDSED